MLNLSKDSIIGIDALAILEAVINIKDKLIEINNIKFSNSNENPN